MKRVLVTHADEPIGRRVVKRLARDPRVEALYLVGRGPTPRAFDGLLCPGSPEAHYARADLARHRSVSDLFHAPRLREACLDTVIHLPRHGACAQPADATPGSDSGLAEAPLWAGVSERTAETRHVVQYSLECPSVTNLVVLGSAFVYRLEPGNANRLTEDSALDLDPRISPEIRAWIDSDMIVHGEVHSERLRVVLLRVPSVVGAGGAIYLNPMLPPGGPGARAIGFDPLCAVISERDVARGIQAALHSARPGIFNLAGGESLPLSELARWSRPPEGGIAAWLRAGARVGAAALGRSPGSLPRGAACLRYGFSLDTARAERELGFQPLDRIGLTRAGDGSLHLEATPTTP